MTNRARGCLSWLLLALTITALLAAARLLWALTNFWLLLVFLFALALAQGR